MKMSRRTDEHVMKICIQDRERNEFIKEYRIDVRSWKQEKLKATSSPYPAYAV